MTANRVSLRPHEIELLLLVAKEGLQEKELVERMGITLSMCHDIKLAIRTKLQANTMAHAVYLWIAQYAE